MSQPILVTGAAGGPQGSTGRFVTQALIQRGLPVRALVHKLDDRSDRLSELGAEVIEGDWLRLEAQIPSEHFSKYLNLIGRTNCFRPRQ